MRIFNTLALTLLSLCLISCSPVYQTTYDFKPPESENGRYCANRCLNKKQECYLQCENITEQCESRKEISNLADVIVESWKKGKVEDGKTPSRHYRQHPNCKQKEQECMARCDNIHRLCHENCGGTVLRETKCVQNCDKIK